MVGVAMKIVVGGKGVDRGVGVISAEITSSPSVQRTAKNRIINRQSKRDIVALQTPMKPVSAIKILVFF